jgi:murein DD-endopeptidase MepM/ murein hydrolase activator NlpD
MQNGAIHQGVDLVPETTYSLGGNAAAGTSVKALYGGFVVVDPGSPYDVIVKDNNSQFTTHYVHVNPAVENGQTIKAGTEIGTIVSAEQDSRVFGGLAHLHIELRVPSNGGFVDPTQLITDLLTPGGH